MPSGVVEGAPYEGTGVRALGSLICCDEGKPTSRPEGTSQTSSLECIGYECSTYNTGRSTERIVRQLL